LGILGTEDDLIAALANGALRGNDEGFEIVFDRRNFVPPIAASRRRSEAARRRRTDADPPTASAKCPAAGKGSTGESALNDQRFHVAVTRWLSDIAYEE
jgi:hypothetical protein